MVRSRPGIRLTIPRRWSHSPGAGIGQAVHQGPVVGERRGAGEEGMGQVESEVPRGQIHGETYASFFLPATGAARVWYMSKRRRFSSSAIRRRIA